MGVLNRVRAGVGRSARIAWPGIPEVLFLREEALGMFLAAVLLFDLNLALGGLVAVAAAYLCARMMGMEQRFSETGCYLYNPLLVGLSLGHLLQVTPAAACLIAGAGAATFLATAMLVHLFSVYLRLPVLSVPFVLVSSLAYLAAHQYAGLAPAPVSQVLWSDLGLPPWIAGFFQAWGGIFLLPSAAAGLLLSLAVLRYSRILFLMSLLGFYTGVLVRAVLIGSAVPAFLDGSNLNFILVAMLVGGVFLVPSPRSYLLAAVASGLCALSLDAVHAILGPLGLPVSAIPFNLVSMGLLYVLGLAGSPLLVVRAGRTPEETLEMQVAAQLRYGTEARTLFLPFSGRWSVWQGWNGRWTHQGDWRHAIDFVITDAFGSTHSGSGDRLEQYYCYGKPVLAPVSGRVVRVVNNLADCAIGSADTANNWGNLVIIEDPRGFYVELSHFATGSIGVREGDPVERGALLGLCGNSGHSPQPHLHVQVQAVNAIGAASLPFTFACFTTGGVYHSYALPEEGQQVEPLFPDKRLARITDFVLDDAQQYQVIRKGRDQGMLSLQVRMAADGTFYFDSGAGQLYFGKHDGTLYQYRAAGTDRWLNQVLVAMPRLPLAYREGMSWEDYVPTSMVTTGLTRLLVGMLSPFWPALAQVRATQVFLHETCIRTTIESRLLRVRKSAVVELDGQKGIAAITIGELHLRRAAREAEVPEPTLETLPAAPPPRLDPAPLSFASYREIGSCAFHS